MRTRPAPRHRLRAQAGESLISMLVGVVISILTIAGMLALYKSMISVSTSATQAARRDGQMAAALLATQMSMQSAGFGLPASAALGTKLHIDTDGKRIVWRSANVNGATSACSGLIIVDDAQATGRGLYQLEPKTCADASDATLAWSATERHPIAGSAAFFVADAGSGSAGSGLAASTDTSDEVGAISLTTGYKFARETSRQCLPYMQQTFVTSAPSSVVVSMRPESGTGMLFQICLPNLIDTTSP